MIKIENLSFGYNKGPLFIKDFNLEVLSGEKVVLLGGEGMGKTSLLKLLCGLERQYVGSIILNEKNISELELKDFGVTYLPSDPVLLRGSLRKNLEFLSDIENVDFSDEYILNVFKLFDFNYDLSYKVQKMCLADKRIFAIIRAYLKNAKIIFVDNQFENIDDKLIVKIKSALNVLFASNNGLKTIIAVDFCDFDKIVYLSYGKQFEFKSLSDLIKNPPDYFATKYFKVYESDVLICLKNGDLFLCEYDNILDKKCKNIDYNTKNMIKISKNEEFFAKNNEVAEGEYIKAKVVFVDEIEELSDNVFNLNLNKKLFVFDALTGEKMF